MLRYKPATLTIERTNEASKISLDGQEMLKKPVKIVNLEHGEDSRALSFRAILDIHKHIIHFLITINSTK